MRSRFRGYSKTIYLASAIATVAVILLVVISLVSWAQQSNAHDYHAKLVTLQSQVGDIPELIEEPTISEAVLRRYNHHMATIQATCSEISSAAEQLSEPGRKNSHQTATDQANKLCEDLVDVTKYSQALYGATQDYLLIRTDNWPTAGSPALRELVDSTSIIIVQTKQTMGQIDYPQVNDPALGELKTGIDGAWRLAGDVQDALSAQDNVMAQVKASQLSQYIAKDQTNFLHARSYFWNNTVQLGRLEQAVAKLLDQSKR